MPRYSPAPLLTTTPRPSTPPTPHRAQPHQDNGASPSLGMHVSSSINNAALSFNPLHSQQQQQPHPQHMNRVSGPAWVGSGTGSLFQQSLGPSSSSSSTSLQQVQWGSTSPMHPASIQWGSASSIPASIGGSHSVGSPLAFSSAHNNDPFLSATAHSSSLYTPPDKSRKSELKRKRTQEDDEDEEMGGPIATAGSSPDRAGGGEGFLRPLASGQGRNLVPKRIRAGLGGVLGLDEGIGFAPASSPMMGASPKGSAADLGQRATDRDVDLGKMLASLDKPHLLSLLSSLLSQQPQIASSIRTLLPLPTLESVNQSLDGYEAAIKSALPFGTHNVAIRSEYAWNRLRGPVGELVSGVQGWMDFFHAKEEQEMEAGGVHPSTMFSLLHTITVRSIKIQKDLLPTVPNQWVSGPSSLHASDGEMRPLTSSKGSSSQQLLFSSLPKGFLSHSNPNSLLTTLIPLLLGAWDGLLSRITHDVNGKGKMFGREVVVTWLRGVEGLAGGEIAVNEAEEGDEQRLAVLRAVQKALKGVEAGLKREIGWVVGLF